MAINKKVDEKLVEKYRPHLKSKSKGKGGIFTTRTCGNLLGIPVKGKKIRVKNYDFRLDVRNKVKNALVDLELFIETAEDKDINKVLNRETLEPVVKALLWSRSNDRLEVARLFMREGFNYLASKGKKGQQDIQFLLRPVG